MEEANIKIIGSEQKLASLINMPVGVVTNLSDFDALGLLVTFDERKSFVLRNAIGRALKSAKISVGFSGF